LAGRFVGRSILIEKGFKPGIWRSPDAQIRAGDLMIAYSSIVLNAKPYSVR
jgi:hypothetical protein